MMKFGNLLKSKFFWIMFISASAVSVCGTLIMGWSVRLFSTVLTISGFVVLALSFFSGWGHGRLSESEGNTGMADAYRKEEGRMQGTISLEGIAAAVLLIIIGTLFYFF